MSGLHRAWVALRVLGGEGLAAARDRALDRLAEARHRRSFTRIDSSALPPGLAWPVLNLASGPPVARLGGVQAQLGTRLAAESTRRPVALLYPEPGGYRLELTWVGPALGGRARQARPRSPGPAHAALAIPAVAPPSPVALADSELERAVAWAAGLTGASTVHVEGAAGLPPASLLKLRGRGMRLLFSLHDFGLFCPRPHLVEHPALRFCDFCRDLARCEACLQRDWAVDAAFQGERRDLGRELLLAAEAVVFPSEFLRRAHLDLFDGDLLAPRWLVVPPAADPVPPLPPRAAGPVRHVALVGGLQVHKGALVFEEVARRLAGDGRRDLRFTVYGGGDAALAARLRKLPGVAVRGYYRAGSLPALLKRDRVDLALLLSTVPETYSLVLGECWAAGVPVVAFDHGAVAERIARHGGGALVPPEAGAAGVARCVEEIVDGTRHLEEPRLAAGELATAEAAAAEFCDFYRRLGLVRG